MDGRSTEKRHLPVASGLRRIAGEMPDKVAIDRNGSITSFGELNAESNRFGNYLLERGIQAAKPVAIFMVDPLKVIPAMIGIFRTGNIFVPLNPHDPSHRLANILNEVKPSCVLVDDKYNAEISKISEMLSTDTTVVNVDEKVFGSFSDESDPGIDLDPDETCYVYYSSGSTGAPKGIAGTHSGIAHFVDWEIETFMVKAGTRVSQLTQPFYDAFLRDIFTPLCAGATICVPDGIETVLNTNKLISWIESSGVNIVHTIPTVFRRILQANPARKSFADVRHILLAGERVLPVDIRQWHEKYGKRIQIVNLYGPSETVMTKLYYIVQEGDERRKAIPIGKPMNDIEVLLMNDKGIPAGQGAIGEICIATGFSLPGYYNRPDLTDEAFVPASYATSGIVYKTGDYGRVLDDGNIEFLGRKDHQVKINGIRVELAEIENQLNTHPLVQESVVHAFEWNGRSVLAAYLVGDRLDNINYRDGLYEYLTARLPQFMLPKQFQLLPELPRLPNGKINYKLLPRFKEQPEDTPFFQSVFEQAYDLTEVRLTRIWEKIIKRTGIRLDDNFFAVGGDSLDVFSVLADIERQFAVDIPLTAFLRNPTIFSLARLIRDRVPEKQSSVVALSSQSTGVPIWLVHPPGGNVLPYARLAVALEPTGTVYGLQYPTLFGGRDIASVEALAAYYIKELRALQPNGPYVLGGWSMGGIIAVELARQLQQAGEAVHFVALFDTELPYAPQSTDSVSPQDKADIEHKAFASLVKFIAEGFGIETGADVFPDRKVIINLLKLVAVQFMGVRFTDKDIGGRHEEAIKIGSQFLKTTLGSKSVWLKLIPFWWVNRLSPEYQLKLIMKVLKRRNLLPRNFDPGNFGLFINAFRKNLIAVCNYRLSLSDIKLVLFNTNLPVATATLEKQWSNVSTQGIDVVHVPGNHFTMLTEPNVNVLAHKIIEIIRIAEAA